MRLVLVSALLLGACAQPPEQGCVPRPGFSFPTSVTPGATSQTLITIAGMTTIPTTPVTCIPTDPTLVTVRATLSGGAQPPRAVPSSITLSTSEESVISVDLSGVQPGTYSLQIFVEPTIAAIIQELIVAVDRSRLPAPRNERACNGRHGRTSLGTSICSEGSLTYVALLPDAGTVRFSGTSATLANDVVWLSGQSNGRAFVERHLERSPGRLERTHVIPLGTERIDAADEDHVWAGPIFATTFSDGGFATQTTSAGDQARLRLIDQGRGVEFSGTQSEICDMDGGCWAAPMMGEIVSAGTSTIWFEQDTGTGLTNGLGGLVRPLTAARVSERVNYSFPELRVWSFGRRLPGPAPLVLYQTAAGPLYIERRDGLFELWQPEPGWSLRDARDSTVEFDTKNGQTAVFFR